MGIVAIRRKGKPTSPCRRNRREGRPHLQALETKERKQSNGTHECMVLNQFMTEVRVQTNTEAWLLPHMDAAKVKEEFRLFPSSQICLPFHTACLNKEEQISRRITACVTAGEHFSWTERKVEHFKVRTVKTVLKDQLL